MKRLRQSIRTRAKRRKGVATLELAVLLPLLMTIALICVDYGRFAHWYIAVTNATRTGAGWGANHPTTAVAKPLWDLGVKKAIEDELSTNNWFNASDLTIVRSEIATESGGLRVVRIEAEYPFDTLITWPFLPGYNDTVKLKKTVTMRLVRQ